MGWAGVFSLVPDVAQTMEGFAPNIVLSDQLAGGSLNSAAFDELAIAENAVDDDLDELDGELSRLAEMVDLGPAGEAGNELGEDEA